MFFKITPIMIFMLVFVNSVHFTKKWRNYASMFIIHCLTSQTINNQHVDAIFGNHCNYARTKLEFWVKTESLPLGPNPMNDMNETISRPKTSLLHNHFSVSSLKAHVTTLKTAQYSN